MFYLKKKLEISASHKLILNYDSPCKELHGHNLQITVFCKNGYLDENGMIVDFKEIKDIVMDKMDHKNLNDVFSFNPTAENIARWIVDTVPYCYKAIVRESENNEVTYEISD